MSVDPITLTAILAMAVVTYLTRIAGLFVADRLVLTGRAKAAFDAIPPAVLVAVIAPTALTTGWAETAAAAVTVVAATRLPLLGTIAVGVVAVVLLRLVDPSLMNADEIAWLDAYHRRVRETLGPDLDGETRAWLDEATRPLG